MDAAGLKHALLAAKVCRGYKCVRRAAKRYAGSQDECHGTLDPGRVQVAWLDMPHPGLGSLSELPLWVSLIRMPCFSTTIG
jgi:hypothetical protein